MQVQDEETSPGSVTNQPPQSPVTTGSTRVSNMRKLHQVVSQSKPHYIHLKDTNQAWLNTSENFSLLLSVYVWDLALLIPTFTNDMNQSTGRQAGIKKKKNWTDLLGYISLQNEVRNQQTIIPHPYSSYNFCCS